MVKSPWQKFTAATTPAKLEKIFTGDIKAIVQNFSEISTKFGGLANLTPSTSPQTRRRWELMVAILEAAATGDNDAVADIVNQLANHTQIHYAKQIQEMQQEGGTAVEEEQQEEAEEQGDTKGPPLSLEDLTVEDDTFDPDQYDSVATDVKQLADSTLDMLDSSGAGAAQTAEEEEKEEDGDFEEVKEPERVVVKGRRRRRIPPPVPQAPAAAAAAAPPPAVEPTPSAPKLEVGDGAKAKPTKADLVPESRLDDKYKTEAELRKDIRYFTKNFSMILQPEMRMLKNIRKGDIDALRRLHRRIVGKLKAGGHTQKKSEKFGVVVDGEEYVKNVIANMLTDKRFAELKPQGAMVDVSRPDGQDKNVLDAGSFEIKRAQGGELAYQREPIYSAIPDTQEGELARDKMQRNHRQPILRFKGAPTKRRDLVHTARRQVKADPFRRRQPAVQLKYLY